MLNKTLNKIFSSRVFYMLFSLLVAIALWMYVEINLEEQNIYEVDGVPVVFRNEDLLRDKGLLISSSDPKNVTLTFECPRAVAARLTKETLMVEVNLETIISTGPAVRGFEIIYPAGIDRNLITREISSVGMITLYVDRLFDQTVPVSVDYRGGTASDDLIADTAIFDPQTIIVSGPEEVVSRIKKAFVPVPKESLSSTYTADLSFILLDDNDAEFDEELLALTTPNIEAVSVTIPIRQWKDVTLNVELMHGAGTSEQNTRVTIEPSIVQLSGDPDAIRDFNSIMLGTIDMTRFRESSTTEAFSIIIPNHLANLSGETEAMVFVEVLGLETDYYSISNLQYINNPLDYRAEVRTQSLDVWIRGKREDLDLITDMNIRVVADLRDLGPGTTRVSAKVYIDGTDADIGAVGDYRLTVTLYRESS